MFTAAAALRGNVTSNTHNTYWKSFHWEIWDICWFFYPFLTTSPSSKIRVSHFLPFGGWQVCITNSLHTILFINDGK